MFKNERRGDTNLLARMAVLGKISLVTLMVSAVALIGHSTAQSATPMLGESRDTSAVQDQDEDHDEAGTVEQRGTPDAPTDATLRLFHDEEFGSILVDPASSESTAPTYEVIAFLEGNVYLPGSDMPEESILADPASTVPTALTSDVITFLEENTNLAGSGVLNEGAEGSDAVNHQDTIDLTLDPGVYMSSQEYAGIPFPDFGPRFN